MLILLSDSKTIVDLKFYISFMYHLTKSYYEKLFPKNCFERPCNIFDQPWMRSRVVTAHRGSRVGVDGW